MAIFGTPGDDLLDGTGGPDEIFGLGGNDTLDGLDGDDVLRGGAGADHLDGGAGIDTASYDDSAVGVTTSLAGTGSTGTATGDTYTSVENLVGSTFADNLTGDGADNSFTGGAGADHLDGGAGEDTARYADSTAAVIVSLITGTGSGGTAEGDTYVSIESIVGSALADTLTGDGGANVLSGGNGYDILAGGAGADILEAGDGGGMLTGGAGTDHLIGGNGSDTAVYTDSTVGVTVNLTTGIGTTGTAYGDTYFLIENIVGSDHDDRLTGGNTLGSLSGGNGNDIISAGAGAAAITGGDGDDTLRGAAGNDTLAGDAGADALAGGAGDDRLSGGAGADHLDGGSGSDTVSYTDSTVGVTADLTGTGSGGTAEGDTYASIETIFGSSFDDTLIGDANANTLNGGGGDDILIGGAGADHFTQDPWPSGTTTVSYVDSLAGVAVDLAAGTASGGTAEGDTFSGIFGIVGSNFADTLTGAFDEITYLDGGTGDDLLISGGNSGDFTTYIPYDLSGGAGNDIMKANMGAERFDGGAGIDTVDYSIGNAQTGGAIVDLQKTIWGRYGAGLYDGDVYFSVENAIGTSVSDRLSGTSGANALSGGSGNDILMGRAGPDHLDGGDGADTAIYTDSTVRVVASLATGVGSAGTATGDIYTSIENLIGSDFGDTLTGNDVANVLTGGLGRDTLTGGAGADRFVYATLADSLASAAGRDLIMDFSHAQADRIDLSAIDASGPATGNQAFTFIGTGAYTHQAGQLRYAVSGDKTVIGGDVNGDGVSDFQIELQGSLWTAPLT
ncbi:beta strand repeat-containing protein [Inquilinus sp. NPDC058860]|uniref:beta strand repeat-containing protein n=1 Tax=Inquilinus sp. NPDC058860 TaxID=3346652 RepID=UPI00369AFAFE